MLSPKKVQWLDFKLFPVNTGVCLTVEAWDALLGELKLQDQWVAPTSGGRCSVLVSDQPGKNAIVIISIDMKKLIDHSIPLSDVIGVVVHECMHAWRFACEEAGETKPGEEVEAYALQALTVETLKVIEDCGYSLVKIPRPPARKR